MLVFNLTDIPTSELIAAQMANISIVVDGIVIRPGESASVKKIVHGELHRYFSLDALAMNQPPQKYLDKKAQMATTPNAIVGVLPIAETEDEPKNKKK